MIQARLIHSEQNVGSVEVTALFRLCSVLYVVPKETVDNWICTSLPGRRNSGARLRTGANCF